MRILTLITIFTLFLFGQSVQELYQKAYNFEKSGNKENAMIYYKKAALKSMQTNEKSNLKLDNNESCEDNTDIFRSSTCPVNDENFTGRMVNNAPNKDINLPGGNDIFGIQTLYENYILPATYDMHAPNDGRRKFETKFQFSIKKSLFENIFGLDETIYIGYTQIAWWQTAKSSYPFRETNYKPEIFIDFPTNFSNFNNLKNVQVGLLHDSNGRDGNMSRSWNRLYMRWVLKYENFALVPMAWWRIPDKNDDNPDIQDYAGNAEIELFYKYRKNNFNIKISNNLHFDNTNRGSVEFGWNFPLFSQVYGYFQYFSGYAENLQDYNKYTNRFSFGFLLFKFD